LIWVEVIYISWWDIALQLRVRIPARMPKTQRLNDSRLTLYSIVEVIANLA